LRIVVDVTPLALPRTGIANYVLGMLQGLAAAGAGQRGRRRRGHPRRSQQREALAAGIERT
jgi:hypothetical protein